MNTGLFVCFLVFLLDVCRGLTWGSWNKDRVQSGWDLEGAQYDELRAVLSDKGVTVISSAMTSELNAGYLSDINVFFTGYIHDSYNTLTSAEQVVLRDWVNVKGGVLVISGCYGSGYSSCRSYLEPFGLNVEEPHYSGDVDSTCSGDHVLLDGVDKIQHTNPEVLVIGESSASTLCELPGGQLVISLLQYGWGYVLFSDMYMYADSRIIENDNIKFVQNLITWTDQLTCDNLAGCPEVLRLPGQCDFGRIDCSTNDLCTTVICDSDTGCVSEPIECDDHNLCTRDFCDIKSGCIFEGVDCDDYDACTLDVCDPSSGGCFHEDPEVCYPTIADTSDQIKELQIMIEQIKREIVPPPIPSSTQQPTSPPTIVSTPVVTPPPVRAIALPTAQPTTSPTHPPTSQPTAIPLVDIVQEFLGDAVLEIQQFMTGQVNQMEARIQAQIADQGNQMEARIQAQITDLQINLEVIEDKVDTLVSALYPSPTQIPTSSPTIIPTNSPTLEPARCEALEDPSKADFASDTGTCFEETQKCLDEIICSEVLTSATCQIPFGVLYGPEHCWQSAGYELPEVLTSAPVSLPGGSVAEEVSLLETSFQFWMELTLCIQRTCDCVSETGRWNVEAGHLSLFVATSHFGCCLACKKTENCAKWHYQGQVCIMFEASAIQDDSPASAYSLRGQVNHVS